MQRSDSHHVCTTKQDSPAWGILGICILIYVAIAAFQLSELGPNSSFYYGTFTEEKNPLWCRRTVLTRKWSFIDKTTLSVPTQLSWGIIPNYVPGGLPVSDYSRDWMFPALRLWTQLAISWKCCSFTHPASLWSICKFSSTPPDDNKR